MSNFETLMPRLSPVSVFVLVCATTSFGSTTPAAAYIDHPWCTGGGGWSGALTCSFDSYEQCRANARTCVANPASTGYPQVPQIRAGAYPRR
ncbi:MAG: DUF3551 domain-containing protein [Xanthobacteraceae bacterium]|nr:DUF3551 domain-containing protein [Xanthobacteraceae bacterium]